MTTASPARRIALSVLLDTDRGPTLSARLAEHDVDALPRRERDFLHELTLGTLRLRGRLDHALARLTSRPLEDLDPAVLGVLRLGAHQILNLRVPARAAVHEAVELARERQPAASGFVNAVLRRLEREGAPALPDPGHDPLAWLVSGGSLPAWVAARWIRNWGAATALERARACLEPPLAAFRANPRRPPAFETTPLPVPGALAAPGADLGALARDGAIYVQDLGSQLVAVLAAIGPRVLDACAAPGGKSTLIADRLGDGGSVVGIERSAERLRSMRRLVERWGATNVTLLRADASKPPLRGAFDAVLLDAPCSGLGTLARHPDLRWRARLPDLARHADRQRALLEALAPLVRPGGRLVFSVCSLEPEETLDVVAPFLARRGDFRPAQLPAWCDRFRDGDFLSTKPERDLSDGFFVAALDRSG